MTASKTSSSDLTSKSSGKEGVDYETIFIRKSRGTLLSLVLLLMVLMASLFFLNRTINWAKELIDPPGDRGAAINLTLPPGATTSGISETLADLEIIPSASAYEWYIRLKGGPEFQAGSYTFHSNSSISQALEVLSAGPNTPEQAEQLRLTIPEGFTVSRIIDLINNTPGLAFSGFDFENELRVGYNSSGVLSDQAMVAEGVIEPYEGLLFPDTYFLTEESSAEDLVVQMISRFDQVLLELGYSEATESVGLSAYEVLTIASLIEREARIPEERGKVSRVIHNRVASNWFLGIDATIVYVTGNNNLSAADLRVDSPYNSRLVRGLPPGPISSPGRAALEAAIEPAPGPWLYYVLVSEDGRHSFSTNNQDFQRDKAKCVERNLCG
ncbi:MAG: endolytic transglycosylase MltG [Actinobacteria bacterium]|nr:endolytic transglycosylase MltG [Actinomycetota bacterium]